MAGGSGFTGLRLWFAEILQSASDFLERHPWIPIGVLVLLYFPAVFSASRIKPLWHDELFTYYIAQAPSLRVLWSQTRTLDLNPPMVYLLTRFSFRVFGVSTLAARLPEIAGFLVLLLCVFRFVHKRMGTLYGAFAVALLLNSAIFPLAVEARPYAVMLGFLGIALVAWQSAASPNAHGRTVSVPVLVVAVAGMLFSHIFALLPLAALLVAELWRSICRRRLDLPVAAALLGPLVVIASYIPLLRSHEKSIYPLDFQPDGTSIFEYYIGSVERELVSLCLVALAVLVLLGVRHLRSEAPSEPPRWFFTQPEWITVIGLLVSPLVLLGYFMATHAAFFDRYGAVETVGVAILTTALLSHWTMLRGKRDSRPALLGTAIVLLISGVGAAIPTEIRAHALLPSIANSEPKPKACTACIRTAALDPDLPLVDASGVTFVEMNHNEPRSTVARLFYLTDPVASRDIAHANIFEHMPDIVQGFHLAGQTEPYADFRRTHTHFFVLGRYDYPEDWLLRKLQADGAEICVLGRVDGPYHDNELYEVNFASAAR